MPGGRPKGITAKSTTPRGYEKAWPLWSWQKLREMNSAFVAAMTTAGVPLTSPSTVPGTQHPRSLDRVPPPRAAIS
jgi:hypothetical protein